MNFASSDHGLTTEKVSAPWTELELLVSDLLLSAWLAECERHPGRPEAPEPTDKTATTSTAACRSGR